MIPINDAAAAVYALLTTDATVSGLVGTRIYPLFAGEQPGRPFIVYQRISGAPMNDLTDDPQVDQRIVQVSCYAETFGGAKQLAEAVRGALAPIGLAVSINDFHESDTRLFRVNIDMSIFSVK